MRLTQIYYGVRWMCSLNDSFNSVVNHLPKSKEITLPPTFFYEGKCLTLLAQLAFSLVTVMLVKEASTRHYGH